MIDLNENEVRHISGGYTVIAHQTSFTYASMTRFCDSISECIDVSCSELYANNLTIIGSGLYKEYRNIDCQSSVGFLTKVSLPLAILACIL